MTYLSEDPTLLAGCLLLVAGGFVVALRATQQGKYLVRAVIAAALAAVVVVVEWVWVTDNERIEQVVYGLRQAVANSDVEGVLGYMTPDVMYFKGDTALEGEATREPDPGQPGPCPVRDRADQRPGDQRGGAIAARDGHVPRLRQGDDGHRRCAFGTANFDLVAGLAGDRAGGLEGEPDHPGADPQRGPVHARGRRRLALLGDPGPMTKRNRASPEGRTAAAATPPIRGSSSRENTEAPGSKE